MRLLILALILFPLMAWGYDLSLRDGSTMKDVKLREKSDLGIKISHEHGMSFIDYSKIPVPDLFMWGYEEEKYRTARAAAEKVAVTPVSASSGQSNFRPTRLYQPSSASSSSTSSSASSSKATDPSVSSSIRSQCSAYTKKGYRCSRMAQAGSTRCYQH